MCLYNAFVLYRVNTNNKKMQFIQFRTNVAEQLLELHRPLRIRNTGGRPSASIPSDTNPLRLVGKWAPFIKYICILAVQLVIFHHQCRKLRQEELALGGDVMYVSTHNMVDTKERTLNICV